MRLLLTSDWQASTSNLDHCHQALGQLLEIIRSEKPDLVIHLGDLKEKFNPLDIRVTNFWVKATQQITAACPSFIVLQGNHDLIAPQDGVPSFLPALASAGADVIDVERTVETESRSLNFVPYFRNPERQKKAFAIVAPNPKGRPSLLFFHCEIAGCERSAYSKGDGIALKDLYPERYDWCFGGHIHRRQRLGKNVLYVGSPFCCDWGEVNESKVFVLYDTETRTVTTIPSRIPGWYDPGAPGFPHGQKDWKGTRIRVSVPVAADPGRQIAEARERLVKQYPGALLQIAPEFHKADKPEKTEIPGTDQELLLKYLEKIPLAADQTPEQVVAVLKSYLPTGGLIGIPQLRFLGVAAKETLSFHEVKLPLDNQGLVLVTGKNLDWGDSRSNGSGKSNLLSLILLGPFGRTPKGQTHDGWRNRRAKGPTYLNSALTLGDGRRLQIIRGRRPSLLRVLLAGKEITLGDANQTQNLIESLTNLTWNVLSNSTYIGQREVGAVFGTDKDRKELFSRLLGLDRFLDAQEKLRKKVLQIGRAASEIDLEVAAAESALRESHSGLSEIERELSSAPTVDTKELERLKKEVETLRSCNLQIMGERAKITPELETNQKEFEEWLEKSTVAEYRAGELRRQLDKSVAVKDRCVLCGSVVSRRHIESYAKELDSQIIKVDREAGKYEALQNQNRQERRKILEQDGTLSKQTALNDQKTLLLNAQVTRLTQAQDAWFRLENQVTRSRNRIAQLESERQIYTDARTWILEQQAFYRLCVDLVGRDGLPAYLCSVAIPTLNEAACYYSSIFTDEEIGIRFVLQKSDLDVEIINNHGGDKTEDQSMGEMRLAGLIVAFAFRDVLVPHNILILDEPGEGLDAWSASAFARGLEAIKGRFGSLFLVSHNPNILDELHPDKHLEVIKEGGVSRLTRIPV